MACEYNNIVSNVENMLSKLSANQKERDDVKPLIKWLNEAKVIGNSNEALDKDLPVTRQNLKESSTYTVYPTANPDMVKARPEFDKLPTYKKGQKTMTYAGIGSRETPMEVLELMTKASTWLGSKGYTLQSGGAIGADMAFEGKAYPKTLTAGSYDVVNKKGKVVLKAGEVVKIGSKRYTDAYYAFIDKSTKGSIVGSDWSEKVKVPNVKSFSSFDVVNNKFGNANKVKVIANELHPSSEGLNQWAEALMARNTYQVFGKNLDTPVDFVLFYAQETNTIRPKGGTGQAVEMARLKGIPTINMGDKDWRAQLMAVLKGVESTNKVDTNVVKEQLKQEEISPETKLKQLLEAYSTGSAPKIGGGLVEDVTWWETRDEDKPKATMMKGTQEESLKDMLPKIDGRKLNKYKTAVNAWYNENKRGNAIRETLNELLEILNSVEQEPRLAEEFGWDSNTNDNSPAYQKESSYKISMGNMWSAAADRNITSNHSKTITFMKDTLDNLKSLYPDIEYIPVDKLTDNGVKILGRAIGRVVEISTFDKVADTIPHEYAHVYIDVLEDTPTIKNVLKKIQNVHNLSIEEAKEFLAKHMGEFYVDKNIPKTVKEINLVRRLWEYILEVFKKITDKNAAEHFKLLDEITLLTTDFKTGKNKELFAENIKSFGVELQTDSVEEVPKDISYEDLVFYNSSTLSKYGTAENYKDYVKTIFPDSKVQDILAHDTGSSWMLDGKNNNFEDSWMFSEDVFIDGKGGNYGLVSGEGFYMYKPAEGKQWDNDAAYTGYMKINTLKPLNSSSSEYTNLEGKNYYSKMSKWTNTELQSNPDSWYMLENPPEKVTINSIVNKQKGYDSFINEVRPGLVEHVAWKNEQVHILGSKKDIEGFKAYMNYKEVTKVPKLGSNNTLLVPAEIDTKNYNIGDLNYKKEFHITALGFPQGKEITKMAETLELQDENGNNISIMDAINQLVTEADLSYKLTDELYKISRDREAWKDWKDQSKGKVVIHEEAVIQLVEADGIKKLVKDINALLGTNFPIPYPHISIATTEGSLGIGIADENAFNKLNKIKLDNNTMKQEKPKQETAKMTANEIIEAAKECAKG